VGASFDASILRGTSSEKGRVRRVHIEMDQQTCAVVHARPVAEQVLLACVGQCGLAQFVSCVQRITAVIDRELQCLLLGTRALSSNIHAVDRIIHSRPSHARPTGLTVTIATFPCVHSINNFLKGNRSSDAAQQQLGAPTTETPTKARIPVLK
jgi:hypothetical protein